MRELEILLVEDSYPDVRWTEVVLDAVKLPHRLTVIDDGAGAWAFLQKHGSYSSAPNPDLILLDINLPKISGDELYTMIKADPALTRIPICVLTNSEMERKFFMSHGLKAKCYIIKPLRYSSLCSALQHFDHLHGHARALEKPSDSLFI